MPRAHLISTVFLALAGGLWMSSGHVQPPADVGTPAPQWATDPSPVYAPKLKPEIQIASYTYRCSDCHRNILSPTETERTLTQHRNITLRHGINTRCFNCHHRTNRDAFVDDYGAEIPYDQPQKLCAKCHGPVYRDWLHGAHGRANGYWDETKGPKSFRKCIECHDPHHPPFPPMRPAPAPDTLRMGEPPNKSDFPHAHDPLRIHHSQTEVNGHEQH